LNYSFTNDELFMLCVIYGSEEVVGLTNPFAALNDEDLSNLAYSTIKLLESKDFISRVQDGWKITEEYEKLVRIMTEFDSSYILAGESTDGEFVFVKDDEAVHLSLSEQVNVTLDYYESTELVKDFFRNRYNNIIVPESSLQYMLSFSSDIVDKAIEQMKTGDVQQALVTLDSDELEREEMTQMLDAIVYPTSAETIISKNALNGQDDETVMKICNTPRCSWIIKISTVDEGRNTMIFKATAEDITKMLFEF